MAELFFQTFYEWRERGRAKRKKLFDDWLLNDALQEAWRARVISSLCVFFIISALINGATTVKTYLEYPAYQSWQFLLLLVSSVYWTVLMGVSWWLARHGKAQQAVYIILVLFLVGPTGLGSIGIREFSNFYNVPLLVLSILLVSLLSKREEQQKLNITIILVWSLYILFQYFLEEDIQKNIPPLMSAIAPGAILSTILFYAILILQFYRLSVSNKILLSSLTVLHFFHQVILLSMETILTRYLTPVVLNYFIDEIKFVLYFLIGGTILSLLVVTRAISNPLTHLTGTVIRVNENNLKLRADLTSIDEFGELAKVFNQLITRLGETLDGLEHQVEERTRDLNVASQVSKQITQVLTLEELLPKLVEETKQGFNLNFSSVYLFDSESRQLVLAAGSGEAGVRMKTEGKAYDIEARPSMVAQAARERRAVVVGDVKEPGTAFNPNPYLPDTRSAVTIPMMIQDELVGVLGLQSTTLNEFSSQEDVRILTSLAEQIAVAVRNARLYENQVRVADELKRVDNLKNQFLASMSHELRTPLNAIINYVAMVADGMMGEVNTEQKELLDGAVKSSRHLLHLINDLLDISKIQAGKLALYVEDDVNVQNELEASLNIASAMILGKPLRIVKDMEKDLPLISGDKRRIRQIVLNLLSNAIKFTDEGIIVLSARRFGDEIVISVVDSGPGISDAAQSLIFEPFTQTEDGIKLEGTGLGLPISRTLAQLHGGRLWVESELGSGAAFHFSLPTVRRAP